MWNHHGFKSLTFTLAFLAGAAHAAAESYRFEALTGPAGGISANAINAGGQVAGSAADPYGYAARAATWSADTGVALLEQHATSSSGLAINSQGQVAGRLWTANEGSGAAVWSRGTESVLPRTSGTTSQYATGINDASLVVGTRSVDYERTFQAVTWQNYDVMPLDMLGATSSFATGVNNLGQVSGYLEYVSETAGKVQAVIWSGDQATLLSGTSGRALAISNSGVAVGDVFDNGTSMPVYWQGSDVAHVLSTPGTGGRALGVNSVGQAVGTAFNGPWDQALLWDLQTGQYTDLNSFLTPYEKASG